MTPTRMTLEQTVKRLGRTYAMLQHFEDDAESQWFVRYQDRFGLMAVKGPYPTWWAAASAHLDEDIRPANPDHIYVTKDWQETYDFGMLPEVAEWYATDIGEITEIGTLHKGPSMYATLIPDGRDGDEPETWEPRVFNTHALAQEALELAKTAYPRATFVTQEAKQ